MQTVSPAERTDQPIAPQHSRPRILLVEDNDGEARPVIRALCSAGYDVMQLRSTKDATTCLQVEKFAFVIVDGALEDGLRDERGAAARFIRASLQEIPYGRISNQPDAVPAELHGKFCFHKREELIQMLNRVEEEVPPTAKGPGQTITPPDLSTLKIPIEAQLAIVVTAEKLDAVDTWLGERGITLRLRSARHNYLLVDDLAPESIRELAERFGAEVRPAAEYRASLNAAK